MVERVKQTGVSRMLAGLSWLAAILAAILCLAVPIVDAAAQTASDSAAVLARVEAYGSAWNTHDASALAAFFTDDADVVMGNLPAAHGRRAIRDSWAEYFERQEPERQLTLDVSPVRFVAPDVAIVHVGTTTGGRDRSGRELSTRRFRGIWVMHSRDDGWLVAAMRGLPREEDRVILNPSAGAAEALRPRIRALVDAFENAFNRHDPSAISGLYGEDAEFVVRNSPVLRGRQAILDWGRTYFSQPRPYRAILIVDDIRMLTPDVALVNLVATGAPPDAEAPVGPVRYTRATWVVVREGTEWRIAALWVLPSEDDRVIRRASDRR